MPFRLIDQVVNNAVSEVSQELAAQKDSSQTITTEQAQEYRQQLKAAQETYTLHKEQLAALYNNIEGLQKEIAKARAKGNSQEIAEKESSLQNTLSARKTLLDQLRRDKEQVFECQKQLVNGLGKAASFYHLEKGIPIALLPVRLETRYFAFDDDHFELRIRIFPDQIHIDNHQHNFTVEEIEEGRRYWDIRRENGPESGETQSAWHNLCEQFGEPRAFTIVELLDPLQKRGRYDEGDIVGDTPVIPAGKVAFGGWMDTPHARCLPDRWVITGYREDKRVLLHWTSPVPPELQAGPDPGEPTVELLNKEDETDSDAGIKWITDFNEAKAVGMAARIKVNKTIARSMDRLMVFGISPSQTKDESTSELESLFSAHKGTGLDFVKSGSPSNNTQVEKTGYRQIQHDHRASHERLINNTSDSPENSNAELMVKAIDVDSSVFCHAQWSQAQPESIAKKVNTALWHTTWGSFLKNYIEASVSSTTMAFARNHFASYVRPGGFMPLLRIESQPYGVLPIVSLTYWRSRQNITREKIFVNSLRSLKDLWWGNIHRVPCLFNTEDPQRSLIEILSQSPKSAVIKRHLCEFEPDSEAYDTKIRFQQWWDSAIQSLKTGTIDFTASFGDVFLSQRGSASQKTEFNFDQPLVSNQEDKSVPLVNNFIDSLSTSSLEQIKEHDIIGADERSILYLLLRSSYLELENDSERSIFINLLNEIKYLSVAELEEYTNDVIDCSSYRLDSWISSVANWRLEETRNIKDAGTYVGGFGWIEGLEPPGEGAVDSTEPEEDKDSAGYIHMPSLSQARTAAILYGARQAHVDIESVNSLKINLTSDRVQLARFIIEGLRQGQSLGALLGYRFERYLIDEELGQYIPDLRALAPSTGEHVYMGNSSAPALSNESVIDGVKLHRLYTQGILYTELGTITTNAVERNKIMNGVYNLHQILDTLSDLLLAEGVHQAAGGNSTRAAAAFDALADGSALMSDLDLIKTPVQGQQLGHRLLLMLPQTVSASPWPGDDRRIRAISEPRLNAWAASMLGPPENIQFTVRFKTDEEANTINRTYSLSDFDLCALDLVYLSSSQNESSSLAEMLRFYLLSKGPDGTGFTGEVIIELQPMESQPDNGRTLEEALTVAHSFSQLLGESRQLAGEYLHVPTADVESVPVSDTARAELENRFQSSRTALEQLISSFYSEPVHIDNWWQAALLTGPVDPAVQDSAATMQDTLNKRLAEAEKIAQDTSAEGVDSQKGIQAILGKDFKVLALFMAANPGELEACFTDQDKLLNNDRTKARLWLHDYARVRSGAQALDMVVTISELLDGPSELKVGQVPFIPNHTWIGEEMPQQGPSPRLSFLAHTPFSLSFQEEMTGLVIDTWTEVIPAPSTTTGLTFNYDEPKGQAPQSLLLALSPDLNRGWNFEDLESALFEAFDLVKIRGLAPWLSPYGVGNYLPALYITEESGEFTPPGELKPTPDEPDSPYGTSTSDFRFGMELIDPQEK